MDWHNLFIAMFSLYVSTCYGRTLTEILSNYDTLNKADIRHRIFRRGLSDNHNRSIYFISHGKKFHVKLVQSREVFDPSFEAVSIDRFGNKKPVYINMDCFYKGYIVNDPASHVTAQLEDDGMLTATIDTANDTYLVEPMWRHVDNKPSHDMIVYKASDLKWNLTNLYPPKGGEPHINTCGNNDSTTDELDDKSYKRFRRSVDTCVTNKNEKDTCKLKLIADYKFYKAVGRGHKQTAILYMLQVINVVNVIYNGTCWHEVGKGIGVQVQDVEVHTDEYSDKYSYNTKDKLNIDILLKELSRSNWSKYCLAHLFTYQDFKHGVIGLAYVANKNSLIGGICSHPRSARYFNCGLTTYINWGRNLTTLEATLVTAHEIGHNFGSNHDSASKQCSPSGDRGNYVMFATSVTGEKPNNRKFSTCSTYQIGAVLKSRPNCLKKRGVRCGNGIIELNEECDQGERTNDPCCKDCKLINNANCSDSNSLCCTNCTYAKPDKVCKRSFALECEDETKCNGTSKDCPKEAPKLTSGSCHLSSFRQGECNTNGTCTTICSLNNATLVPCSCPPGSNACKVCCKLIGSSDKGCVPYHRGITENDGVHCNIATGVEGLCDGGTCRKLQRNVRDTYKNLLLDFSLDKAVKFMENNIVLTILIFSLLIWIPAGCVVNQIDRSEERRLYEREKSRNQFMVTKEPKGSFKKPGENLRVRTGQHVGM